MKFKHKERKIRKGLFWKIEKPVWENQGVVEDAVVEVEELGECDCDEMVWEAVKERKG